ASCWSCLALALYGFLLRYLLFALCIILGLLCWFWLWFGFGLFLRFRWFWLFFKHYLCWFLGQFRLYFWLRLWFYFIDSLRSGLRRHGKHRYFKSRRRWWRRIHFV